MSLIKAIFFNLDEGTPVPVMFNPPEYSLKRSNNFAEVKAPGKELPTLQFINKEMEVLDLNLFFDTSEQGIDVQLFTKPVLNLAKVKKSIGAPPRLLLVWGTMAFECIMINADLTFKEFSKFGWGVRAEIRVSLKGYNKLDSIF